MIVPSLTWVSTANAVAYTGAQPVLVDVELSSFNIDPRAIEAAITPKTKAIMVVHLFGRSARISEIMEIADAHGLAVIEDSACALGTFYRGRHVGTFGDLGIFSFHPRKIITTGEGGMVITRDEALHERVMSLRNHGASSRPKNLAVDAPKYLLGDFEHITQLSNARHSWCAGEPNAEIAPDAWERQAQAPDTMRDSEIYPA